MISRRILEDLLQEPLGPYRDRDILHETACQMKGATKPVLYSFVLERDGYVTGLDASELDGQSDDCTFRFRGILKIADPDWLSDFGIKTVEAELNLRATERALREGERRVPPLTLEGLFFESKLLARSDDSAWGRDDDTKLTVLIQGEKSLPAIYMFFSHVPDGLLWSSKAHNRKYQVATMNVETYARSQNFFWRWRLFALMEKISKRYPYIAPRKRTPVWFAEKYLATFACPPEDKHRRLIFDDEDTDIDETGKTITPRHLLKPHMSEILGLFAAQAKWFITNEGVKRKKLFDITSWEKFAKEVQKQRKEADRQGVRWGWPEGGEDEGGGEEEEEEEEEGDWDEDEDGGSEDGLDKMVRENPVIGKSNSTVVRKLQLARAKSGRETGPRFSSGSGSEGDAPGGAEYLSDFSEASDAEVNDSDHRLAEEEAIDQIPWQLQLPPLLPDVDGRWGCPLQECNYRIDLYDLTQEEGRGVPEELVEYIQQKQWRNAAYDERVLQGFGLMVTNHYSKHFEERGVRIERKEGRTRFAFINDGRRRRGDEEPIRGPMPARGTLGGESRVVPIVHAPQAGHFQ